MGKVYYFNTGDEIKNLITPKEEDGEVYICNECECSDLNVTDGGEVLCSDCGYKLPLMAFEPDDIM